MKKKKHRKLESDKQIGVQLKIKIERSTSKTISNWRSYWSAFVVFFLLWCIDSIQLLSLFELSIMLFSHLSLSCVFSVDHWFRRRQWIFIATAEYMCGHVQRDFELSIWRFSHLDLETINDPVLNFFRFQGCFRFEERTLACLTPKAIHVQECKVEFSKILSTCRCHSTCSWCICHRKFPFKVDYSIYSIILSSMPFSVDTILLCLLIFVNQTVYSTVVK